MKDKIRIGNAGGFWGDDLHALKRQLSGGQLDYITTDYLAEITMSILRKQQLKDPKLGYITDFVDQMDEVAELVIDKKVKIIVNAGGINPLECSRQVINRLKAKNLSMKIAIIEGDNIIDDIKEFYPHKADFKNLEDGEDFSPIKDKVQSANVYLGVQPLVKALEEGAQLIIAGRVTDTSITLAPMIYEFGWKYNDWDKLASGIVAGHMIECGAQSSGGNFTDWEKVPDWSNFGYPIVEMSANGNFVVAKHKNTGGLVSIDTVKEQVVYEMGDPTTYISPDVIANFQTINLNPDGENRVKVSGIKGKPSTKTYKVSIAYEDGYKASGTIIISGPDAIQKANTFAEIFWKRLGIDFIKNNHELVGYNACHKNLVDNQLANEVLLKLDVYDFDPKKIEEFSKSIAPLILSGPPGVAVTGGRPRMQSVMTFWPALLDKSLVKSRVSLINNEGEIAKSFEISGLTGFEEDLKTTHKLTDNQYTKKIAGHEDFKMVKVPYKRICLARSGDKGDTVNIGIIARSTEIYDFIKHKLTEKEIKTMFHSFCKGEVKRYELDNIEALNFLLEKSLDGGGTKSLMIDAQGKTFASAFLSQMVEVPENLLTLPK